MSVNSKNVVFEVNEPMDAVCSNRDFSQIAVAGRAVMKIFTMSENGFEPSLDLRAKTRRMNLYFSGSVSWNPNRENLLAAASSIGSIVLFDLEHCHGSNPQDAISFYDPDTMLSGPEYQFRAHKAAATKVCFHEFNPNVFVSACKDASLLLYDTRKPEPVTHFMVSGGSIDTIRDLMFGLDSASQDIFVTGDDSGTVRFWDMRHPEKCVREMLGHQGPVSGIALHQAPECRHLIATAGRDRYVRVWDWTSDNSDFLYSVETPFPISRVKWNPEEQNEVATVSATESQVLFWDIRRPYFPFSTYGPYDSTVSDIAFPRSRGLKRFVTSSKDRRLIMHFSGRGDDTMQFQRPFDLSSPSPFNEIICAVPEGILTEKACSEYRCEGPARSALVHYVNPPAAVSCSNKFSELAKRYRFMGDNPINICNHNAEVARRCGDIDLSYTWKVVGVLMNEGRMFKPKKTYSGEDKYFEYLRNPEFTKDLREQRVETVDSSDSSDIDESFVSGAFSQSLQYALSTSSDFFFGPGEFSRDGLTDGQAFADIFLCKHSLNVVGDEAISYSQQKPDDIGTDASLNGDDEGLAMSQGLSGEVPQLGDGEHDIYSEDMLPSSSSEQSLLVDQINDNNIDETLIRSCSVEADTRSGTDFRTNQLNIASVKYTWGPITRLIKIMNSYTDVCDSQTCATICLIIGDVAKDLFGSDQVCSWFLHYIAELQNSGYGDLATFISKNSGCEEVVKSLQENMHVKIYCGNCNTPAPVSSESCPKCETTFVAICTVCDNEVKGLFAQCKDCGHGGHQGHLEEWFRNFGVCPFPGCEHVCVPSNVDDTESADLDESNIVAQSAFVDSDRSVYFRAEDGSITALNKSVENLLLDNDVSFTFD